MKAYCAIFLTIQILCTLWGSVLAVTECYKCPEAAADCQDPVDIGKLVKETCGAPAAGAGGGAGKGEGEGEGEAKAERLLERQGDFVCLKATVNGSIIRQCGMGCADLPADGGACKECKEELCNASIQIKPIAWIFLLIAIMCVGLEY